MAGTVYLRTNRFEVKLEGIVFKTRDFESLCSEDFLFPDGKTWARAPVVGVDVMQHPRDPSNVLLLLCFGIGCVILKFNSGDELPDSIMKFLTDERIRFVGFGIPEKRDLFPFEELCLKKERVDIGYMAARFHDDFRYKKCELAELARRVLRVKSMIGLTQSSSFERHEKIKCAICQLFITTAIAMTLLGKTEKKKSGNNTPKSGGSTPKSGRNSSFLKNLNQLPLFTEGWLKFPRAKKTLPEKPVESLETTVIDGFSGKGLPNDTFDVQFTDESFEDDPFHGNAVNIPLGGDDDDDGEDYRRFRVKGIKNFFDGALNFFKNKDGVCSESDDPSKEASTCPEMNKQPLKGILKCSPSIRLTSPTPTPDSTSSDEATMAKKTLRRANSKGFNVSFKEHWLCE